MNEVKKMYESLVKVYNEDHEMWVKSNFRMRSIEDALRKLEGDPVVEAGTNDYEHGYAAKVLKEEYEMLKSFNKKMTHQLEGSARSVRIFENAAEELGIDLKAE